MIRAGRACLVLLALLAALLAPRAAQAEEPGSVEQRAPEGAYAVSPEGRRFRVRFDPASRISLGVGSAFGWDDARPLAQGPEVQIGLSYRSLHESGEGPSRVVWQVDSRAFAGWVSPMARPIPGVPSLDAAVYGASLLRHDESPRVVLPLSPPVSLPFPFNVGIEGEVARVWIPSPPPTTATGAPLPMIRFGVLRASALLDPWRSGVPGRSVEIGLGVRYDVDAYAEDAGARALGAARVIHRVAPMTAGSLRVRVQSGDGLMALDCRGDVVPHWSSEGRWRVMVLSAAHVERTLVAINDQPITAFAEGGYRLLPPAPAEGALEPSAGPLHDARLSLGLAFHLQLK